MGKRPPSLFPTQIAAALPLNATVIARDNGEGGFFTGLPIIFPSVMSFALSLNATAIFREMGDMRIRYEPI